MKSMKSSSGVLVLFILTAGLAAPPAPAEESKRPVIIAASGTSYAEGSSPVTCLLDPECRGYWSPRSLDAGTNEGLYLRFQTPTLFNFIEIMTEEELPEGLAFELYLDAHSSQRLGVVKGQTEDGEGGLIKVINIDQVNDTENGPARYIVSSFLLGEDDSLWSPLGYRGQSVFIKLAASEYNQERQGLSAPRITSLRFSDQKELKRTEEPDSQVLAPDPLTPMPLELPVLIPAQATASSTLEPGFAYEVSKLFDSQPDMAWSTNGKKSRGIGESITVNFESEQEIHGLMLWNGYQRSDTHYQANARVKALKLAGQTLRVKDAQGPQIVRLPQPVKTVEAKLEISEIYPGGSYKDVLMSELRFLGPGDRILLPWVPAAAPTPPPALAEVLDRSFAPILHFSGPFEPDPQGDCGPDCVYYDSSLRLRSNGTFVIYTNTWEEFPNRRSSVIEGNWEPQEDGALRLFGKKYQTNIWSNFSSYLKDDPKTAQDRAAAPRIFQSVMEVKRFTSLSPAEKENLARYQLQSKWIEYDDEGGLKKGLPPDGPAAILLYAEGDMSFIGGPDPGTAVKNVVAKLDELNPLYVKSDVFTELLLPRHTRHSDR